MKKVALESFSHTQQNSFCCRNAKCISQSLRTSICAFQSPTAVPGNAWQDQKRNNIQAVKYSTEMSQDSKRN